MPGDLRERIPEDPLFFWSGWSSRDENHMVFGFLAGICRTPNTSSIAFNRIALLFLAFSAFLCLAKSGEWWEEKPVTRWSNEQVYEFLNTSPWVSGSQGYFLQAPWVSGTDGRDRKAPVITVYYQARILSAKPVRDAFLQLHVLNPAVVTAKSIQTATAAEELRNRLQELLVSYPDDPLVKGDEKRVIIAVSQKIRSLEIFGAKSEQEIFRGDELSDVDQSRVVVVTRLATNAGKHAELADYRPPGTKQPGAMYFFLRNLPDGTPLVTDSDKELLFETVINGRQLSFKFDLGKMKYRGRLEI
jgi:hypothetical protein